jgi:hypothetical protein
MWDYVIYTHGHDSSRTISAAPNYLITTLSDRIEKRADCREWVCQRGAQQIAASGGEPQPGQWEERATVSEATPSLLGNVITTDDATTSRW